MRRLVLFIPLLAFAAIVGIAMVILQATSTGGRDSTAIGFSMTGQTAPPLTMPRLNINGAGGDAAGGTIALADMAGRGYAVNVFASWCAPCKLEAPAIETIAESIPVIGINYRDTPEDAAAFLQDFGNPYHAIAADPDGGFSIRLGVHGLPETFIIAPDGTILHHQQGPVLADALRGALGAAIAKAAGGRP